jgi:mono/diheme cytochrome c family protein
VDRSVAPQLKQKAERAPDWRTRLQALWTLDGIDSLEPATVIRALEDSSRDVRASAVRLTERWLDQPAHPIHAALLARMDDADWAVRRQLAATLGALPAAAEGKVTAISTLLERHGHDPIVVDAALSGLSGEEPVVLERLLRATAETPQRAAAVATLAATIVRSGQDHTTQNILQQASDQGRPAWQRNAILQGAEAALLNAPLPGSGRRGAGGGRASAAATGNAPGSRAGPGGAPAFPRAEPGGSVAQGPAGRGRGNTPAPVALTREPAALVALASTGDVTGKRAATLLARLTWPGKQVPAGAAPAAAPLTAEEQKRFEDGRTIYATLCVACHQEDGRGREKLAPALVESNFALGPATVPIRILLSGKEGPVGLMPPMGSALNDDQIAAVLTYTRRAWGNQASAVDAATVAATRKASADRTRPWTEAELIKMGEGK